MSRIFSSGLICFYPGDTKPGILRLPGFALQTNLLHHIFQPVRPDIFIILL